MSSRRVVVVHDYLTQRGGAERVVLCLMRMFPRARLLTSFYSPKTTFEEFTSYRVEELAPRPLRKLRHDPRMALLALPKIFGSTIIQEADLVICSTSGFAHGVKSPAPKVAYCYTPARWLYESADYARDLGPAARGVLSAATPALKAWDRSKAAGVNKYITLSSVVAKRIEHAYGIVADIIPPPSSLTPNGAQEAIDGISPGYFLTISRNRGYKNTDVLVDAAVTAGRRIVVVGTAKSRVIARPDLVTFTGHVTDAELRWLYANARAVVSASHEDFGLTPVEGYQFGTPSLALRAGGFLDTIKERQTGTFFERPVVADIEIAMRNFDIPRDSASIKINAARYTEDKFSQDLSASINHAVRECESPPRT